MRLHSLCALLGLVSACVTAAPRNEVDLSGKGWRLFYDAQASWKNDELFFPAPDLSRLPVNPPTGGWQVLNSGKPVAVPGTVEEYLQKVPGPEGDLHGVSWWYRTVQIPAATSPRRLLLRFESIRLRAEVFVNRKLAGYDLVGNTPLEVDITNSAKPGETAEIAVRVTDPGGNYDWRDGSTIKWGRYLVPGSHAFGGITGRVRLISCDPVYIDEIYTQNTPSITRANAEITVNNTTGTETAGNLTVRVFERRNPGVEVFRTELTDVKLAPGANQLQVKVDAPTAKLWDTDNPNLYVLDASLQGGDSVRQVFGFRWFEPSGIGKDAVFRLNGKRIVLRTSISWGFWPINGIYPTEELAEKQIRVAKEMGLNMLNFHRTIGSPIVLEKADEIGLLYYEEPGNYKSSDRDKLVLALSREKLLRLVRRDRSHPSLVIYNMINESGIVNDLKVLENRKRDMQDAHRIDPSRVITHTSAWATAPDVDCTSKMHMRPFDDTVYMNGWYDFHHAGGPAVWNQSFYRDPANYYNHTENRKEIVFWGEEGAISTPPRLEKIKAALEAAPEKGWDGLMYLDWYKATADFLTRKNLKKAFPTVDAFTTALASVSLEHQGRKIETIRMSDVSDGYAINGWEAEIVENHSGVVDCFRNPKADPAIVARYNQPLYVAVKVRSEVVKTGGEVVTDFYAINEKNLRGPHTLVVTAKDPTGKTVFSTQREVSLQGGEVFGQLLVEGIPVATGTAPGLYRIDAVLKNPAGQDQARGSDQILAVDWQSAKLRGNGAVWESGAQLAGFLKNGLNLNAPQYKDNLGRLDWVLVSNPPGPTDLTTVARESLRGLKATFFDNGDLTRPLVQRQDRDIALAIADGATPDPAVPMTANFTVRYEGELVPPATGTYTFSIQSSGGTKLVIGGKTLVQSADLRGAKQPLATVDLEAGKAVPLLVELDHRKGPARCELRWATPSAGMPDPQKLLDRARRDGTTVIVIDHAPAWMDIIRKNAPITYGGEFRVGTSWMGGIHFVRQHPLFRDLPVDGAMNWPYQAVVKNGNERSVLQLEGEELVAGAYHAFPMQLGTVVGVIPCGKGRIVVSTLALSENVTANEGPAEVARKLLVNYIQFAGEGE